MPLTIGIGIDAVTLGGATLQSVRADLRAERDGLTIDSLEFRAPGFTQVGLSGRLDAASWEFAGPVTLNVPDPTTLIAWLDGVDLANRKLAAFRMRGDVALGRKHIAELLDPGLIYVADTAPFAKALAENGLVPKMDEAYAAEMADLPPKPGQPVPVA